MQNASRNAPTTTTVHGAAGMCSLSCLHLDFTESITSSASLLLEGIEDLRCNSADLIAGLDHPQLSLSQDIA